MEKKQRTSQGGLVAAEHAVRVLLAAGLVNVAGELACVVEHLAGVLLRAFGHVGICGASPSGGGVIDRQKDRERTVEGLCDDG